MIPGSYQFEYQIYIFFKLHQNQIKFSYILNKYCRMLYFLFYKYILTNIINLMLFF